MKRVVLALIAFATLAGTASAVEFKVGATLDDVRISGVRAYSAAGNPTNESRTPSKLAGGLFVRAGLGKWEIGAQYRYLSGVNGFGIAPSGDIFDDRSPAITYVAALTPYTMQEKIHEISASVGYLLIDVPFVDITVGPTVSRFASSVDFRAPGSGAFYRSFSASDYRAGAFARASFSFFGPWSLDVNYRYSTPPGRRLQSLGIGFGIGI
jgi:hypothetical protein